MRRALFVLLAGVALVLGAMAQSSASNFSSTKTVPNMTPIVKEAACRGWGACPPGYTRACRAGHCWCRPC